MKPTSSFNRCNSKNLKGLKVILTNNRLLWQAFFDNEPTEDEKEVLSIACIEVLADFPNINEVQEEYIFHPSPLTVTTIHEWAFVRWEPETEQEKPTHQNRSKNE